MQPHHLTIALAALWLLTLVALPFLASMASRRAKESGFTAGLAQREADHTRQLATLNADVDALAKERLDEQRTHARISEQRLALIAELEARIMSYTGLAVTMSDHQLLHQVTQTLSMASKTWSKLQGAEPWQRRASAQFVDLASLASRIRAEVSNNRPQAKQCQEVA